MTEHWTKRSKCPRDCAYGFREGEQTYCQYILLTEHRRPCPPGWKDCTVYERRQGAAQPPRPTLAAGAAQLRPCTRPEPTKQPPKQQRRASCRASPAELDAQIDFLRRLRRERGLTQLQVSRAVGMSLNAVATWEQGICRANWARLEQAFPGTRESWERRKAEEGIP